MLPEEFCGAFGWLNLGTELIHSRENAYGLRNTSGATGIGRGGRKCAQLFCCEIQ